MNKNQKPLPVIRTDTKEFWEGCRRHQLLIQRCRECGTYRYPPQPMCSTCNSMNHEWKRVSGEGEIYSWIVIRENPYRPVRPGFAEDRPYTIALVQLSDVPTLRILSNIINCPIDDIAIGLAVRVSFKDMTDSLSLPYFEPA